MLRAAALSLGELLAWIVADNPYIRRPGAADPSGLASTNTEVRARWSKTCRAIGALAACAATQLVMASGGHPVLSLGDDLLVVRGGPGSEKGST